MMGRMLIRVLVGAAKQLLKVRFLSDILHFLLKFDEGVNYAR
jgi:hypothetical protein